MARPRKRARKIAAAIGVAMCGARGSTETSTRGQVDVMAKFRPFGEGP